MAKVQGPLQSMDASGTVGGTITFSKWKGRNYVRSRVTPHNPRSSAQTGVRSNMAGLVALFKANVAAIDSAWLTLAKQRNISAFNAFTGEMQRRRSQNLYAAITPDPTNAAPAANVSGLAASVSNRYVSITWTDSVSADAWAVAIYRKLGSDPTGVNNEQVALIPAGRQEWQDGPLLSGTWHYVASAVSNNGGRHAVSAAVTAVVA